MQSMDKQKDVKSNQFHDKFLCRNVLVHKQIQVCSSTGPTAKNQGQPTDDCGGEMLKSDKCELLIETKLLHIWKTGVC